VCYENKKDTVHLLSLILFGWTKRSTLFHSISKNKTKQKNLNFKYKKGKQTKQKKKESCYDPKF